MVAKQVNKLSARAVVTMTRPGRHSDGGGLYLVIEKSGSRRWAFLFRQNGRLREMGLGGLTAVPLALARRLAADCRKTIATGGDPIAERKGSRRAVPTFGSLADELIKTKEQGWRNDRHRSAWVMTLREYAAPIRGQAS